VVQWPFLIVTEPNIQVCSGTESSTGASQDDNLDAIVDIEHRKEMLEVLDHLQGECVIMGRSIQRHNHNGRHRRRTRWMMRNYDVPCRWDILVGGGKLNGGWIEDHDGSSVPQLGDDSQAFMYDHIWLGMNGDLGCTIILIGYITPPL
jgi:hypothetical protein